MKTGILLAAFGTATPQGEATLRRFAQRVRDRYPDVPVRWAFTSPAMRERLAGARKKSDSVGKALRKMAFERYESIAVQPLHVVPGIEYTDVLDECAAVASQFSALAAGAPLLAGGEDMDALARALLAGLPPSRAAGDAVLFAGHGSRHDSAAYYAALSRAVTGIDPLAFVATMKGEVQLHQALPLLLAKGVRHVWLVPLLAVIGRHALEDLAGNRPDSWRTLLEAQGLTCTPVLTGMAEMPCFADVWIDHLDKALRLLETSDPQPPSHDCHARRIR